MAPKDINRQTHLDLMHLLMPTEPFSKNPSSSNELLSKQPNWGLSIANCLIGAGLMSSITSIVRFSVRELRPDTPSDTLSKHNGRTDTLSTSCQASRQPRRCHASSQPRRRHASSQPHRRHYQEYQAIDNCRELRHARRLEIKILLQQIDAIQTLIKKHNKRAGTPITPIRLTFNEEENSKEKDEDLKRSYKEVLKSPFTRRIIEFSAPSHRMPTNLKIYDGSTDPDDHITRYVRAANQREWETLVWCRMFQQTLNGPVRGWFNRLPNGCIDSWTDLCERYAERFALRRKCSKDPTEVSKIIRRVNDTLPDFKERWTEEMSYIQGVPELMQISAFMGNAKCPKLAYKSTELPKGEHMEKGQGTSYRGDRPPRAGYYTNDFYQLKRQLEAALEFENLSHLVKDVRQRGNDRRRHPSSVDTNSYGAGGIFQRTTYSDEKNRIECNVRERRVVPKNHDEVHCAGRETSNSRKKARQRGTQKRKGTYRRGGLGQSRVSGAKGYHQQAILAIMPILVDISAKRKQGLAQKRRVLSPEKIKAVMKEVEEWVKAGIVRPVRYSTWISNLVLMNKVDEGIRANPKKMKAVADMQSPRTLKEMQSLSGKLAALNRFLSKSAERALPFFKTLKNITKENKDDYQWMEDAKLAF
ncbi:hypothetical protein Tco_1393946 [Tanacetum coccineum]